MRRNLFLTSLFILSPLTAMAAPSSPLKGALTEARERITAFSSVMAAARVPNGIVNKALEVERRAAKRLLDKERKGVLEVNDTAEATKVALNYGMVYLSRNPITGGPKLMNYRTYKNALHFSDYSGRYVRDYIGVKDGELVHVHSSRAMHGQDQEKQLKISPIAAGSVGPGGTVIPKDSFLKVMREGNPYRSLSNEYSLLKRTSRGLKELSLDEGTFRQLFNASENARKNFLP